MHSDLSEILLSKQEIEYRVQELGNLIAQDYRGKQLHMVSVLKGSMVFMADLMRTIDLPLTIDCMAVSSYGSGAVSAGVVQVVKDLSTPAEGKDVLVVEDVMDTGLSLASIIGLLGGRGARSVRVCTLLNKPGRRHPTVALQPDYVGFEIPDVFVVGYGLDYNELYRNLPYIGVLDRRIYSV